MKQIDTLVSGFCHSALEALDAVLIQNLRISETENTARPKRVFGM